MEYKGISVKRDTYEVVTTFKGVKFIKILERILMNLESKINEIQEEDLITQGSKSSVIAVRIYLDTYEKIIFIKSRIFEKYKIVVNTDTIIKLACKYGEE